MDFLDKYDVHINNKELLLTALTHTSYAYEHHIPSYERLEFLGDAVLQLISSEYLYKNMNLKEGEMSKVRASYVCEDALYEYAKKMSILIYHNILFISNIIQTIFLKLHQLFCFH